MQIIFSPKARKDLDNWIVAGNKRAIKKVNLLIKDIQQNPYDGIGKPEPLKYELAGLWSRRIDRKNRMVYEIDEHTKIISILSLKGHY